MVSQIGVSQYSYLDTDIQTIFRCLYRRCLPLPIPNREVKPARADGTAVKRGRVGRCPIFILKPPPLCGRGFIGFYKTGKWQIEEYACH